MASQTFAPSKLPVGVLPYPDSPPYAWLPAAWAPFDRGDMPRTAGRNRVVDDDGHVWECELRDTDRSGYSNSCRNEAYRDKDTGGGIRVGETAAAAFGIRLADDFPAPPAWMTCWQIHTPSDYPPGYASPMTALVLDGGVFRVRNNALGTVIAEFPYHRGRYNYLAIEAPISRSDATVKVWHSLDTLPDATKPPTFQALNRTAPPSGDKPSYMKSGLYRSTGAAGLIHVARYDGIVFDTSAQAALATLRGICRAAATGTQPPPPPPPPGPSVVEQMAALIAESIAAGRRNAWYYRKFLEHNPVLAPAVVDYLEGGPRPPDELVGDNHYAWQFVKAEDARRLAG